MSTGFGKLEDAWDLYGLRDFEKNLIRQFWENCDQITGKIKIAEIVVRGTMFDSPYRGCLSRYSRYFTANDSPSTCLQVNQKSLVYGWKCPHYRRSNLRDRSTYDTCRARDHVWLPISQNPEVRTSKFCSNPQNFLCTSDVWKIRKIDSSEVSRFRGQSTGKIKIGPKLSCEGPCLTPNISERWNQNFKILQQPTELFAYIRFLKNNKNRFVGS